MLIKEFKNIPVAAPQIENMTEALAMFKSFMNNESITMARFVDFLNQPSLDRDNFLALFSEELSVVNNRYVKIKLTNADTTL